MSQKQTYQSAGIGGNEISVPLHVENVQYWVKTVGREIKSEKGVVEFASRYRESLESITGIPASNQKLLHKVFAQASDEAGLAPLFAAAGIETAEQISALKVLMIGTSAKDRDEVVRKDNVLEIRKKREQSAPKSKPRDPNSPSRTFSFGTVVPLPEFSDSIQAKNMLIRLREDIGIIEVMRKHQWFIPLLTELHPNDKTILGFNKNKGQEISIRLRTDKLDGFRHYATVVKVLLHELVHMVHSDHNEAFHEMNSVLNKEYARFSGGLITGGGREDGSRIFSGVEEEGRRQGYVGGSFVLGGEGPSGIAGLQPQREVVLAAAEKRKLEQWEQEMADACDEQKGKVHEQ
ncbi:hypothetical protein HDU98_012228 [Podochytrium sp. JEL0797]|nr:hypothetical protein HDU98_012228 [Podochytrium sp. JEL0797]